MSLDGRVRLAWPRAGIPRSLTGIYGFVTLGRYRTALRAALSGETKAYGFTLVIWGTGALVDAERGSPGRLGAIAFIAGALCGMGLAVLITFGGPRATWTQQSLRRQAAGAIHVLSVGGALALGWGLGAAIPDRALAYLVAGAAAAIAYQLLLGVEVALSAVGKPLGKVEADDQVEA